MSNNLYKLSWVIAVSVMLVATSCTPRDQFRPGVFKLDAGKSRFLPGTPDQSKTKLVLWLNSDGSAQMYPFSDQGTWTRQQDELILSMEDLLGVLEIMETNSKGSDSSSKLPPRVTLHLKIRNSNELEWRPRSIKPSNPTSMVFVR